MNDDSIVKVMQSLDLDYSKAISSTLQFQNNVGSLNKELENMKSIAMKSAKEINNAFSSQLGNLDVGFLREYNKMFANLDKQNKPIEIKVETDKAEIKMQEFVKNMGIKLDKNLRQQFQGLSEGLMGEFDEGKFKHLGERIGVAFSKSMAQEHKRISREAIKDVEEAYKFATNYFAKGQGINADGFGIKQAINEIDGFKEAMRGVIPISDKYSGSLETLQSEMKNMGAFVGKNTEGYHEFARALMEVIQRYREFKATGTIENLDPMLGIGGDVNKYVEEELMKLTTELASIQYESKKTEVALTGLSDSAPPIKSVNTILDSLKGEVKDLGVVTTKTFKDMNNEVYKYIDTYKNFKQGISISDTYTKNEQGGFDFQGRIVNDKSMEINYKAIERAHIEALKLNSAIDETILKNRQLADNSYWKQEFQNVSKTSDEIKKLNSHYADEEKRTANTMKREHSDALKINKLRDQEIAKVKASNIEQMKSQAASVQQRVASKGLSGEYGKQATMLRDQLTIIQSRLQTEGKLTAEEVKQTNEIKEQLDMLRAQTKTAISDDMKDNPSTLGDEFSRRSSWFLTGGIFYGTINAAKKATSTIKDVEMGMVELSRVMNDSSFVFEDYRDNLFQLGVEYGQTFENVQAIALRWAQSGYNVADSLELTKTSLLALNTAELDATNATESMIGIMAQWELKAEDLALVMDKVNITADNYSVTSQDLVDGLLRSSGAAKIMGMSLDDTIATLTVLRETTGRTGQEVGNALNSILSYIQRPKSIDVLESLGIRMFADEAKTEFRNVMEVFDELSKKWQDPSMSKGAKDALMAGAQEAGLFSEELAIATDTQEEYISMTEKAAEAQGEFTDIEKRDAAQAAAGVYRRNYFIALLEKFSKTQDVLNGLVDAGGYSLEENAKSMETLEKKMESLKISAEALAVAIGDAGLSDGFKMLADGGTDVLNSINNLPKGMKDLILATTTTFVAVKTLQLGMKTFGIELPGISQVIGSLTAGTWSLSAALQAGGTGLATFAKANAPLLALSASIGVIIAISNAIKKQREEQEKAIELFNQQKDTYSDVNNLLSSYKDLAGASSLATDEQEKLVEVKQKIIDLLPQSKSFLDDENLSLSEQVGIVKELNEQELKRLELNAQKVISKGESNYEKDLKELERQKELLENLQEMARNLTLKGLKEPLGSFESKELERYTKAIDEAEKEIANLTSGTKAYEDAKKTLKAIYEDNLESLIAESGAIADVEDAQKSLQETMDGLTKSFDDSTTKLQNYYSILDEVNSKEGLSAKSKQDIISKHQELLPYLSDEKELRKQLMKIISDEEKTQKNAYANMLSYNEDFYNTKIKGNADLVKSLNEYYGVDFANYKSLADAKGKIEVELVKQLSGIWAQYYRAISQGSTNTEAMLEDQVMKKRGNYKEASKVLSVVHKIGDMENAFNKLSLKLGGVNFRGISAGGLSSKSPSSSSGGSSKDSTASAKYENKALAEALKLLEHKKRMSEETQASLKAELAELNRINDVYVKTADERMDVAERIYSTEKRYMDRRLQDSIGWINKKKEMNELSIEEEIAGWERIKAKQSDNNEALRQAELNLYKLRGQVRTENFNAEDNTIKHLTKLGVMGTEEQIKAYKKLYEVKADSLDDERNRVENLFGLYKKLLGEQQDSLKDAYDKRMDQINSEEKASIDKINLELNTKKDVQDEIIKGIERELGLLNRQENEYDHDKKMADLREQLAYWEVRTSEDARKKVIELKKQIDEAEHKREVELKKEGLEDKKQIAQDEISDAEEKAKKEIELAESTAKTEREKWEKSYKLTEKAFDEHGTNIVALASTMSKDAYKEWLDNYITPMQKALSSGDLGSFESTVGKLEGSISGLENNVTNSKNSQIYRLANQILGLKRQYEVGADKSASDRAVSVYSELSKLKPTVADQLHRMDYLTAKKYVEGLPKMHKGGMSLSYGAVEMMPGELVFPPDLSIKLEGLIGALYQRPINKNSSTSTTDNRKEVKIENLVRIDKNYMEDEVDSDMFARELQRQLSSIV